MVGEVYPVLQGHSILKHSIYLVSQLKPFYFILDIFFIYCILFSTILCHAALIHKIIQHFVAPDIVQAAFGPNNWDRRLQRSLISGGQMPSESSEVKNGYQNGNGNQKTYDLIPHMTYIHWFHILTSRGKHIL